MSVPPSARGEQRVTQEIHQHDLAQHAERQIELAVALDRDGTQLVRELARRSRHHHHGAAICARQRRRGRRDVADHGLAGARKARVGRTRRQRHRHVHPPKTALSCGVAATQLEVVGTRHQGYREAIAVVGQHVGRRLGFARRPAVHAPLGVCTRADVRHQSARSQRFVRRIHPYADEAAVEHLARHRFFDVRRRGDTFRWGAGHEQRRQPDRDQSHPPLAAPVR